MRLISSFVVERSSAPYLRISLQGMLHLPIVPLPLLSVPSRQNGMSMYPFPLLILLCYAICHHLYIAYTLLSLNTLFPYTPSILIYLTDSSLVPPLLLSIASIAPNPDRSRAVSCTRDTVSAVRFSFLTLLFTCLLSLIHSS